MQKLSEKPFRAKQIYNWLHKGKAEIGGATDYIDGVGATKNFYQASGKNAEGLYTIGEGPVGSAKIAGTLVPGFFGGSEVTSVGSMVTKETMGMDGIMEGDILIQYDGGVRFCLYVGEGKFVTMDTKNPNGTAPEIVEAKQVLDRCFDSSVLFFAVLRPSFMVGS